MKYAVNLGLILASISISVVTLAAPSKAAKLPKLSTRAVMKCIEKNKTTQMAFDDLEAAQEMRLIPAQEFYKVLDQAISCPQLDKDLQTLHEVIVKRTGGPTIQGGIAGSGSSSSGNTGSGFGSVPGFGASSTSPAFKPIVPPIMDQGFGGGFDDDDDGFDF